MTITRRLALLWPATVAIGAAAFSSTPARAAMKTQSIGERRARADDIAGRAQTLRMDSRSR
jgi:hypothetical protein